MPQPFLEVQGLQAWYGEGRVLHGIDLDVNAGETVAILGRNGAGKSTTLKCICGALDRRSGRIRLGGTDIADLPTHRIARLGLSYVPEERGIFSTLTVQENLMLPPVWGTGGLGLADIFELFPHLAERASSPGTTLSGGEQQMLAIARVLRVGPKIVLMDEPTEGLAPVIVKRIGQVILSLKARGVAVLLVEQNFKFVSELADRFYVMATGHVVDTFHRQDLAVKAATLDRLLAV